MIKIQVSLLDIKETIIKYWELTKDETDTIMNMKSLDDIELVLDDWGYIASEYELGHYLFYDMVELMSTTPRLKAGVSLEGFYD